MIVIGCTGKTMRPFYYFAYGSNLHPLRLRERAPSARVLGNALLRGYLLKIHKRGRDRSAKCDAWRTGRRGDLVHGIVYRIARSERRFIDRAEDSGRGYDRVRLLVSLRGRPRQVFTYLARSEAIAQELRPFDWYLGYVLRGGRHHGLPQRYLRELDRSEKLRDPSRARRLVNRRLLLRGAPPHRRR
jgi:gamma-glutamylcyclotransferase